MDHGILGVLCHPICHVCKPLGHANWGCQYFGVVGLRTHSWSISGRFLSEKGKCKSHLYIRFNIGDIGFNLLYLPIFITSMGWQHMAVRIDDHLGRHSLFMVQRTWMYTINDSGIHYQQTDVIQNKSKWPSSFCLLNYWLFVNPLITTIIPNNC